MEAARNAISSLMGGSNKDEPEASGSTQTTESSGGTSGLATGQGDTTGTSTLGASGAGSDLLSKSSDNTNEGLGSTADTSASRNVGTDSSNTTTTHNAVTSGAPETTSAATGNEGVTTGDSGTTSTATGNEGVSESSGNAAGDAVAPSTQRQENTRDPTEGKTDTTPPDVATVVSNAAGTDAATKVEAHNQTNQSASDSATSQFADMQKHPDGKIADEGDKSSHSLLHKEGSDDSKDGKSSGFASLIKRVSSSDDKDDKTEQVEKKEPEQEKGPDPALQGGTAPPKMSGTGAPGSHSALFGLTPDGSKSKETTGATSSSSDGGVGESELSNKNTGAGDSLGKDDVGSRAPVGGGVADQLDDPKVAEKGYQAAGTSAQPTTELGSGEKAGAGGLTLKPEQGTGV